MDLAKGHVDVGLFSNQRERQLGFWQDEAGLPFEEMLPVGGGVRQHRHGMNGSVLKMNDARDPLPSAAPSGYRELFIAREGLGQAKTLLDPDRSRITLVPPGEQGVVGIGVRLAVRDPDAFHRFYELALGLERCGDRAYRCGNSVLMFDADPDAGAEAELQASGLRYLTIQVRDVDREHARALAEGGREGRAPLTLGKTARISFVRDPDGNWIELSQRASLTGPLPS